MKKFLEDIEIAALAKKQPIFQVAKSINLSEDIVYPYGKYKAKVDNTQVNTKQDSKLVLVTAISPTPAGEGKTTTTIGLHDGLSLAGHKSIAAIREPSLGPVFGVKGGAAGGGWSQVVPIEEINLHFTGDLHAITSANNLISSMIDNHIYFGNDLKIDKVVWKRCMDCNDRALRDITLESKRVKRTDHFQITAASEIMAIFSLAKDSEDLRNRIDRAIVAYDINNKPIFVKDVRATGPAMALLKDAFLPNLVQTIENNPVFVHGGPFANIAHGCNTVVATKVAMKTAEYVITEAGFGSDLGAEKFLNIKCRTANIKPSTIVLVATIRALKMHGGVNKNELSTKNTEALKKGIANLQQHLNSLRTFNIPVVVSINKFATDTEDEINILKDWAKTQNVEIALSNGWAEGGKGMQELVNLVVKNAKAPITPTYTYSPEDSIEEKITKVAKTIYGAADVNFSQEAKDKIQLLKNNNLDKQLICIAKTQNSFSDDPKLLGAPKGWTLNVRDLDISNGAGFIVVISGNIMTMPGLSRDPQAHKIDVQNNKIVGLS